MQRIIISLMLFSSLTSLQAQFIEDALRYTIPNSMITPISSSLGVSYYGISDDVSALFYNPAGLSFIPKTEFSIGFGFNRNITQTEYLFNKLERRSNSGYITHIGFATPIPSEKFQITGAVSYFHENNFLNYFDYSSFNPYSSIVYSLSKYGPQDTNANIPYFLWLADKKFHTPIKDSVQQNVFVNQDGGLHNISGGISVQLSHNVAIGGTLAGKFGKFSYYRDFRENDVINKYNFFDSINYSNIDFQSFTLKEKIEQKISGITGSIGLIATLSDVMRFGATIKFPTYYQIEENFRKDAFARFDDGWEPNPYEPKEDSYNSYKITTPFVYSAGVSFKVLNFVFSGGVEYFDVTQLRFSDAPPQMEELNTRIVRELVGQVQWGIGTKYFVPLLPIELRAGFSSITSPYQRDISKATTYIFSFGAGVTISNNIRLEPTFQFLTNSLLLTNYKSSEFDPSGEYKVNFSPIKFGLQLTIRY
ncbi:MAG: hypothetical protein ACUVQ1_07585 [Candidatus Kapaibacteriales bacterium]